MRSTEDGHVYELKNLESDEHQTLSFIRKEPVEEESSELKTVHDGTTNEEVLEMLIDRLQYLQVAMPCRENAIVITKLEESLMWLLNRTANRKVRGVEGTRNK